jgi:hypothetical protein
MVDSLSPMVPADVDLRDFAFMPLDVLRLRDSELSATPDAEAFRCAVLSWCVSWHQVPAGSLPDDDTTLARLLGFGRDLKGWKKVRESDGLRGWVKCSDGRLYHPVVAEKALEAWKAKLAQRARTEAARKAREEARQKQQQSQSQGLSQTLGSSVTDDVTESKGQGQGQGEVNPSVASDADDEKQAALPDCPHDRILALYAEKLPELPQPRIWEGKRQDHLRTRWRWVIGDLKRKGKPHDHAAGIDFFARLFDYIRRCPLLMGEKGEWSADLGWIVNAENFAKILQGNYEKKKEAA